MDDKNGRDMLCRGLGRATHYLLDEKQKKKGEMNMCLFKKKVKPLNTFILRKYRQEALDRLQFIGSWSGFWETSIDGVRYRIETVSGFKYVVGDSGIFIQNAIIDRIKLRRDPKKISIVSRKIERNNTTDTIIQTEKQKHILSREDTINAMAMAFAQQESNFDSQAVSPCGQWVGCLQLSKIMVREANRIVGFDCFNYDDRYDRQGSFAIFKIVQQHHNPNLEIDRAIEVWNPGCGSDYRDSVKKYFKYNIKNYNTLKNYYEI